MTVDGAVLLLVGVLYLRLGVTDHLLEGRAAGRQREQFLTQVLKRQVELTLSKNW